jgi:formylglycine-generating enzyme required for sulfatase activity
MNFRLAYILFLGLSFLTACSKTNESSDKAEKQADTTTKQNVQPISSTVKMVYIPGGGYKPFYGAVDSNPVKVAPFLIDEHAVTNKEYLSFVTANPEWRKSRIPKIYADSSYLYNWPSDLELPHNVSPDAPVCFVSWFAAKAYAKSVGKRLPSLDEWEFLAMADAQIPNARNKKEYSAAIIDLYLQKNRQYNPVKKSSPNYWGVYNMFDLIWEWTDDFNSILSVGDSRNGSVEGGSLFCAAGSNKASDVNNYAAFMRYSMRTSVKANYTIANMGFRCAKDTIVTVSITK